MQHGFWWLPLRYSAVLLFNACVKKFKLPGYTTENMVYFVKHNSLAHLQEFKIIGIDNMIANTSTSYDWYIDSLMFENGRGPGPGDYSRSGFAVVLTRDPSPFFTNTYLPTGLLTIISFIGFVIPVDMVPGRMALLVTIFLMLVNISTTERNRGPIVRTIRIQHYKAFIELISFRLQA